MLKQSYNDIRILGKLNDIDLTERDSAKDGRHYISGKISFLVEQKVSGMMEQEIIPVQIFAFEKTNAGNANPAYQNAYDLMTKGTSIAAVGEIDKADIYELNSGRIRENIFQSRDGTIVSYTQIDGSFFTKRKPGEFEDEASFEQEIIIANMIEEEVDETPTGRLLIDGLVIQYNGLPDKVRYVVENKEAIAYITQNWEVEDTVKVSGKIRFCAQTMESQSNEEVGFGEAPTHTRVRTIREFVITSGTPPYDEDRKYDCEEVTEALARKKHESEERLKQQQQAKTRTSSLGGTTTSSNRLNRGF